MEDSWELGESRHLTRERTGVPREGTAVGDYLLLRRLGSGAMGTVYVGRHRETAIEHAVKIVDRLTPGSSRRARFEREAAALSRLSHPGVIRVHQFGIQETVGYFSMDLVEGTPLDELVEAGPLPKAEALRIAGAIAEALAHLHAAGITHRDLKPANVLIRTDDGAPVLVDFGLARVAEDARLTQSAQLVGTPRYMAPEQILGEQEQVGPATDVFALGVLLCELLGGELPFRGSDLVSLASNIVRGEPELPADLEPALRSLLLGLLAKAPPNRPTAAWAADACARLARGETVRIRNAFPWRRFLAGASVVGSLSLLVAAALWTKGSPAPPPPRPSLAGAGAIVQTASAPASPPRAPQAAEALEKRRAALADAVRSRFGLAVPWDEVGDEAVDLARLGLASLRGWDGPAADAFRARLLDTLCTALLSCPAKQLEEHRDRRAELHRLVERLDPDGRRAELCAALLAHLEAPRSPTLPPRFDRLLAQESGDLPPRWAALLQGLRILLRRPRLLPEERLRLTEHFRAPPLDAVSQHEVDLLDAAALQLVVAARRNLAAALARGGSLPVTAYRLCAHATAESLRLRRKSCLGDMSEYDELAVDAVALWACGGDFERAREALARLHPPLQHTVRRKAELLTAELLLAEGKAAEAEARLRVLPTVPDEVGVEVDALFLRVRCRLAVGDRAGARRILEGAAKTQGLFARLPWRSIAIARRLLAGAKPFAKLARALRRRAPRKP